MSRIPRGRAGHGLRLLLAVPVVALAVAACSSSSSGGQASSSAPGESAATSSAGAASSASSTEKTTIKLLGCCSADQLKTLISSFEAKYPNITVTQEIVPFENLNDTVVSRLSGKDDSFDVYEADQPRTAALASKGYLKDLTSTYLPKTKGTLFPSSVTASTYQDKLWSAPLWTSSNILYYNKALLAAAGITDPSISPSARWTWQQLSAAALKAKAKGASCGFMFDQPDRYYQLQPLIESAGGDSGLGGENNLTPDVNSPGWNKAMDLYSQFFASGASPRGVPAEQSRALFASGKCAFFVGVPAIPDFTKAGLDYGIAPMPDYAGGKAYTPSDSFALGINPNTKNADAAEQFIEYASVSTEGNLAAVADNPNPTPNIAALPIFFKAVEASDKHLAGIGDLVNYELNNTVVHRPASTGYVEFETVTGTAFSDIRNGKPVGSTLDAAQKQLKAELSR